MEDFSIGHQVHRIFTPCSQLFSHHLPRLLGSDQWGLVANLHTLMNLNPCSEEQMSNYIATLTVALGCALGISVQAQDSIVQTKTKVKGEDARTVTYTGCMQVVRKREPTFSTR
jgi:hypothetical protein